MYLLALFVCAFSSYTVCESLTNLPKGEIQLYTGSARSPSFSLLLMAKGCLSNCTAKQPLCGFQQVSGYPGVDPLQWFGFGFLMLNERSGKVTRNVVQSARVYSF